MYIHHSTETSGMSQDTPYDPSFARVHSQNVHTNKTKTSLARAYVTKWLVNKFHLSDLIKNRNKNNHILIGCHILEGLYVHIYRFMKENFQLLYILALSDIT